MPSPQSGASFPGTHRASSTAGTPGPSALKSSTPLQVASRPVTPKASTVHQRLIPG
jgi:hypothetical protein